MRILIVYTTRYGMTERASELVKMLFEDRGHKVDVSRVEEDPSPSGYDLVIMGAPVYRDGPHWGLMEWIKRHRGELEEVPKVFFLVAMHLAGSAFMGKLHGGIAYAQSLLDAFEVPPFYGTLIGGEIDPEKMSDEDRMKMRRFYAVLGEKLEKKSLFSEKDVEAFVRRTLLYYEWFGKHFKRGEVEKAKDFEFMGKVRELERLIG
ncbi:flavodoxin domain-containing protein [Thermococcus waiotapuensis]|uniref:Flavodoxin domain-containing protein n=1 Tax=Thermococcus waiotapuensis TaxID=90909 RepID=A0AAE4NVH4_9EURY|nr:flavodoxin domain-containing protein [Thermococcus waiotapuensis]MDV3103894.1 flavodoxin domain-containing protein [Thermococcus waiotapuensis]